MFVLKKITLGNDLEFVWQNDFLQLFIYFLSISLVPLFVLCLAFKMADDAELKA